MHLIRSENEMRKLAIHIHMRRKRLGLVLVHEAKEKRKKEEGPLLHKARHHEPHFPPVDRKK